MEIKTQYERKFLIKELPDLSDFRKEEIEQWYLTPPNKEKSIRIRKYNDNRCYIDIIKGFGKLREKIGKKTDWSKHKERIDKYPSIKKTRYKKEFGDILMVIDIFEDGLKLVEIESYDNEFCVNNFDIPRWFGKEVTESIEYTNNWLAYNKDV